MMGTFIMKELKTGGRKLLFNPFEPNGYGNGSSGWNGVNNSQYLLVPSE